MKSAHRELTDGRWQCNEDGKTTAASSSQPLGSDAVPVPTTGETELDADDEHIDSDVRIPGTAETGDPPIEDDADELQQYHMSNEKASLVASLERQLRTAHIQQGMDASDKDIEEMAICLCELSACDVPELFTQSKFDTGRTHSYGLRPGFCIDLTAKNQNGQFWNLSDAEDRKKLLRLQDKEKPKLLVAATPKTPDSAPERGFP